MILILLILVASLILQFFLPWWIIALVAFALAWYKAQTATHAFWSGFAAIFVLWIVMGLIQSVPNENLLANRVGEMFMLPLESMNWLVMLIVAGIIGGLVGGVSALAGFYSRNALKSNGRLKGV